MKNLKKIFAGLILAGISLMILGCGNNATMPQMYTVSYSLGEGVEGSAPADSNLYLAGQTVTIAAAVERSGYTFTAWNDGKADYVAGSSYTIGISNVTFTAQWKKNEVKKEAVTTTTTTYTVTYSLGEGVEGTAPTDDKKYKSGDKVTLAAASARANYNFSKWNDGTNDYDAGAEYTMGSANVTFTAKWTAWGQVEAPTFSVAAGAVASGTTVTITCTTAGASIFYTTDGSTPTSSGTAYSTPVTIDAAMTLKAIAIKSGMNDSAVASAEYTIEGSTGFLQGAGTVAKANIEISGNSYQKTGEVVIIPAGKQAVIDMRDDSSWNTYLADSASAGYKGAFIKDRKVTLSPFVMGQYEVTQELYNVVMGSNPSNFTTGAESGENQNLRPVEQVSHYEALAFCNELTKKTMTASDVVYFSDAAKTIAYTTADATAKNTPYMDITKKGYRLPTEAEWEYAARGGNPQSADWKNAFGKVTAKNNAKVYDGTTYLNSDDNLATVGWYGYNSGSKHHEVGLKDKNNLNLYDMQGNVWQWCWDWSVDIATGNETDPVGASGGSSRVYRGGSWNGFACSCAVSCRGGGSPDSHTITLGFRVVRTAN